MTKGETILTKDYFEENPYKRIHNIELGKLKAEHNKTHQTLIEGIFLIIYTHFEGYLKDILILANKVENSIKPLESKLEDTNEDFLLIDKVLNRIALDKANFDNQLFTSLDYIRLKRNRLIHSNADNISNSLNGIIRNQGNELNHYWNSKLPKQLQGIDFSSKKNANELSFNTIIDIINIFRGIASEIDNAVINRLTNIKIAEKIIIPAFKEIQGKKINKMKSARLEDKFKRFCLSTFGLTVDEEILKIFN